MKRAGYHLFASLLALGAAMPAAAQQTTPQPAPRPTPAADQTSDRDVVVVTANKREESVQDVAVAVTAITSEAKEELGIISVTDLTNVTPGLAYTPGNERVTLRGIGRQTNSFGADPGVANYNDGIYTAFAIFAGKDPILIERVEVLRGPQGTLYGRNSIGGAINTVSRRPTDEFNFDVVLGAGDYDAVKAGIAVSGPITDWLRYRAAYFRETREGINFNYGSLETEGWEIDDTYAEIQLEGDITDRWTWWFKTVESTYDKAGPPGGRTATFSTAPFITSGAFSTATSLNPIASYAFSGNTAINSFEQIGNRRDNPFATNREHAYNVNIPATARLPQYDEYILESTYSFDDFDIKYTGGYTFYDYRLDGDIDGTSVNSLTYRAIGPSIAACNALVGTPITGNSGLGITPATAAGCAGLNTVTRTVSTDLDNEYKESRSFFSNEINLISTNDSPFQWILGIYGYQENNDQPGTKLHLRNEPGVLGTYQSYDGNFYASKGFLYEVRNSSLQNSYGLYGRIDYSFTDEWKLSAGLRYSYDLKQLTDEGFASCFIVCRSFATSVPLVAPATGQALRSATFTGFTSDYVLTTPLAFANAFSTDPNVSPSNVTGIFYTADGFARRSLTNHWDAVTGDLGVEWRPTTDTLLFGKYSRGYKAGAINTAFSPDLYAISREEIVDVYEAGWKQEWFDGALTTNVAAFRYDYTDMQAAIGVVLNQGVVGAERTVGVLVNIPQAISQGIELESNWNPIDPLNINFNYSYLDTEITDGGGTYVDPSRDGRFATVAGAIVYNDPLSRITLEGHELPQAPRNKVSLSATYLFEFENGSTLLPAISYYWRDKFYDDIVNSPNAQAPTQEQVDARLTWRSADNRFAVILWGRNLTDSEQNTSVSANTFRTADSGRYQTFSYAPPRMIGIDLKFHFE
jgi:iron complex outermembrane receptor protein